MWVVLSPEKLTVNVVRRLCGGGGYGLLVARLFLRAGPHAGSCCSAAAARVFQDEAEIETDDTSRQAGQRTVTFHRGDAPLGLKIKGGSDVHMPVLITHITPGSSAASTRQLFVGDVILEVNGHKMDSIPHSDAIEILRGAKPEVRMVVEYNAAGTLCGAGRAARPLRGPCGS